MDGLKWKIKILKVEDPLKFVKEPLGINRDAEFWDLKKWWYSLEEWIKNKNLTFIQLAFLGFHTTIKRTIEIRELEGGIKIE